MTQRSQKDNEGGGYGVDENTIWCSKQNHPELVVMDCRREFNLSDAECEKLRFILMNRGVNKWLFARRRFIKLKHEVKKMMKDVECELGVRTIEYRRIQRINEGMQNIAKMPRWVEWGTHIHKDMRNNEKEIIVRGRHC